MILPRKLHIFARGVGGDPAATRVTDERTSEQAWLTDCMDNPALVSIEKRIERIVGVPATNMESWQVVKYQGKRKYYKEHSDWIDNMHTLYPGARFATFFIYLTTNYHGGQTRFAFQRHRGEKGITPIRGTAVLWYNGLEGDGMHPPRQDGRVDHAALELENDDDLKIGANLWMHTRDFRVAWRNGNVYKPWAED